MKQRYIDLLPKIRDAAWECGYAIGQHGTGERDFDLIAAPWWEDSSSAEQLIETIRKAVDGFTDGPTRKPHGRLAWSIHLDPPELYLDVSVMPRSPIHHV